MKTDCRDILHILEKEVKPEGLPQRLLDELRELFGSELTLVDAINMLAAAVKEKDTAEAINEAAEGRKKEPLIFYDVKEVAEALKCSIPTAREIMRRADFPCLKVANTMKVSKTALEQWAMQKRA